MKIKLNTKFFASVLFVLFVFLYNLNSYIITRSSSKEAIFINVNWIINNLIDYGDPPVKLEEIFPYIDSNQYYNYFLLEIILQLHKKLHHQIMLLK